MSQIKNKITKAQIFLALLVAVTLSLAPAAFAAAPGITGPEFNLTAKQAHITQPDGAMVYSWGYGCTGAQPGFAPEAMAHTPCPEMQIPGPTLIVHEGDQVIVHLTNNLPTVAGNTSILFPGFNVATSCNDASPSGAQGLLTCEAVPTGTVTYTFTATTPGTRSYYSGTQSDLQVEMGMYGAIIVLPASRSACADSKSIRTNLYGLSTETDFRLAHNAYDHDKSCYDREYLFQFSEIDPRIHRQAEEVVKCVATDAAPCPTNMNSVATEPYIPAYFMINGRSMPDLMDPNYAPEYPHQPYNGNPHMHPGEQVLLRIVGQGRWQHPFHEHGNHVRVLGRDGNIILSESGPDLLAGPALFTTTTTPGQAIDGIYYWTGKGLNWDAYGHNSDAGSTGHADCIPDANGYNTDPSQYAKINYFEWCQDHNKPMQAIPFGDVGHGGPMTLPDPNLFANGAWFGGSPYLGPDATVRAVGSTGTTPPSGTVANSPTDEAGFAFMWHSHNEREITTNNIFPGGMMMMMLVDSREFVIDESN